MLGMTTNEFEQLEAITDEFDGEAVFFLRHLLTKEKEEYLKLYTAMQGKVGEDDLMVREARIVIEQCNALIKKLEEES